MATEKKQYTVKEIEKLISEASVSESEAENVGIASNMIFLYMQDIKKSDGMGLIKFNLIKHFNIEDKESIRILNQKLTEVLKNHEKNAKRNGENDEGEDGIKLPFDEVAERVIKKQPLFVMKDTGEFFLYNNGVYRSDISNRLINKMIRDEYKEFFFEQWNEKFPGEFPEKVPAAKSGYVSEVMEYMKAYRHKQRVEIDAEQGKYVNFKNGLFDLKKWKLIPHTPDVITIAQVNATYDKDAKCPNINAYLSSCRLPDESQTILIEYSGYCLTYDVWLQKALMLYGNGSNGKSVFINLLKSILGYDLVSGESLQQLENDKYRVANLYGKTLNAFPDLKDTPLQTNEVFNRLTGNDFMLTGERKYQNSFDFNNTAKLLFSANRPPLVDSDNYAYYRRWELIEFPHTFENDEIDEKLIDKLTTEGEKSGFVNLMLEGLKRLRENHKLSFSRGVNETEKIYLLHADNVTAFEERCIRDCIGNEGPTEKKQVYNYYQTWCKTLNLIPVKEKQFTKKLKQLGRKAFDTTIYPNGHQTHFRCYENTVVDFQ